MKTRIHRAGIGRLGAAFLNLEGADELERRVQEVVSEELKGEEVPLSPSERALLERQLGKLSGKLDLKVAGGDLFTLPVPPTPPAGLPSSLLIRRPGVRAAEQTMIAANAQHCAA